MNFWSALGLAVFAAGVAIGVMLAAYYLTPLGTP